MATCVYSQDGTATLYTGARPWTPGTPLLVSASNKVVIAPGGLSSGRTLEVGANASMGAARISFGSGSAQGSVGVSESEGLLEVSGWGASDQDRSLRLRGDSRLSLVSSSPVSVIAPGATIDGGALRFERSVGGQQSSAAPPSASAYGGVGSRVVMRAGSSGAILTALGADSQGSAWYTAPGRHDFYVGTTTRVPLSVTPSGIVVDGTITDASGTRIWPPLVDPGSGGGTTALVTSSVVLRSSFDDVEVGQVENLCAEPGNPGLRGSSVIPALQGQSARVWVRGAPLEGGPCTVSMKLVCADPVASPSPLSWVDVPGGAFSQASEGPSAGFFSAKSGWVTLPAGPKVYGLAVLSCVPRSSGTPPAATFRLGNAWVELVESSPSS